jgi:hypothetical protein
MSSNLLGELVANNGTYYLAGSENSYMGNIDQIIVRGNGVVIGKIFVEIDGVNENLVDDYLSSQNVPNGLRITPKDGKVFTGIQFTGATATDCGVELVLSA